MALTFGSLFAGIGGFDLGFERAGMRCLWQVEIDPFCQKVLAKHWPAAERFSDVGNCGKHNLRAVDVICGGLPCQPHSVAGEQRGAEDDRDLWPEMRRIVDELKPAWVVCENVPGIKFTILDGLLSDLETLGYDAIPIGLPACALDAPIPRERIFIMAISKPVGCSALQIQPSGARGRDRSAAQAWGGHVLHRGSSGRLWRIPDPRICRVADGVPCGLDRLGALGNAVVPQVAEWLGRRIVAVAAGRSDSQRHCVL